MRKQTLYLALAAILIALLFFFPLATLTSMAPVGATEVSRDVVTFDIWGLHYSTGSSDSLIYLGILISAALAVTIVALLFRKKRWLQVRMCFVLAILLTGVLFFEGMYTYKLHLIDGFLINFSPILLAPLFSMPLVYFAYRGITKDIVLLASADRLR